MGISQNALAQKKSIADEKMAVIKAEDFKKLSNFKSIPVHGVFFAGNNKLTMAFGDNKSNDNNVKILSTYSGTYNYYAHIGPQGFNKGRDVNLNREKEGQFKDAFTYMFKKTMSFWFFCFIIVIIIITVIHIYFS